jgi:hypothetical protein
MAAAAQARGAGYSMDVKFEYGVPQTVAFKFLSGKNVDGQFGARVMFTLIDGRKIWLDAEDGSDIERSLSEMQIKVGEFVQITKIRHPRGGGHSFRVEAIERQAPAPSRMEADLEKSVVMARRDGAKAFIAPQPPPAVPDPPASAKGTMGNLLAGALIASIDAYIVAADYARSKGIAVDMRLDITGEDLRSSATAMLIEYWRNGGTR